MADPVIRDWEHFRAVRFDRRVWAPLVRAVLRRHGRPAQAVELASSVHVVAVAGDVTVKLYQPLDPGACETEAAALRLLGEAGLPVPRLLASGRVFDADGGWPWPYCVMSTMPGVPLDQVPGDRRGVAVALGRFLRRMHGLRPGGARFDAPGFLAARLAACAAEHRRRAVVPPHLLAGMDAFLERARPVVLDGCRGSAVTHGDLHEGNVDAERVDGAPRVVGVLDLNDVRITDPHYDLVVVHLRVLDLDRRLLRALLDAYGWGPTGPAWATRMMALTVAHDFDELGALLAARPALAGARSLDDLAARLWRA